MDSENTRPVDSFKNVWWYRMQVLSCCLLIITSSYGPFLSYFLLYFILYGPLWWLGLIYLVYIINDGQIASRGSRLSEKLRDFVLYKALADYCPTKLIKTVDLDPSKNYLALSYPHGLLMLSQFLAFETNALNYKKLFPGLTSYMAHVDGRFSAPFLRELFLRLGGISASEHSLLYVLDNKKFKGNLVALNSGGTAESMETGREDYVIILKNKKGWARVAIKSGASVLPVFAFGETRIFDTKASPKGTFMRKFEDWFSSVTGIAPIPPKGRTFFNFLLTPLPHQRPIYVVVGAPIDVKQNANPTREEIDELHQKFVESVTKLFEEHKHKYEKDPNVKLIIE